MIDVTEQEDKKIWNGMMHCGGSSQKKKKIMPTSSNVTEHKSPWV